MLERIIFTLTFAAAIGSGVVGGIFYAFSSFVMAALGSLPSAQGADAMKAINVTVINPVFMLAFMGTAVLCLVLAGASLIGWGRPGGMLILAASLLYLVGCFGVTMLFNVPLNNELAAVAPAQEAALWSRYLDLWTVWNHVRTLASILSAILLIAALLVARAGPVLS